MKTKEQVIKEAYGDSWDKVEGYVDEDGRLKINNVKTIGNLPLTFEVLDNIFVRPKSLQGIKNNNNWIKIESEDDLPNGSGVYFTANSMGVKVNPVNSQEVRVLFLNDLAAYYQPIQKPKPPIY